MSRSTFSVGVDVDSLWHYYRIHGLDEAQASDHAWEVGVPRFMSLFDALGLPATFYCVAEDIERSPSCPMIIKEMSDRGFEIGNHSWHHPYALTTLTHEVATREITEGKRLLEEASQSIVSGFRAPGYHTHRLLHQPLIESGHRYESSAFPCAPYYIAKAMVMGGMRLLGRRSQSILGPPTLLTAPHQPLSRWTREPLSSALSPRRAEYAHAHSLPDRGVVWPTAYRYIISATRTSGRALSWPRGSPWNASRRASPHHRIPRR